jgi:hypothetical protein
MPAMTMLVRGTWIAIALAACGSDDDGPPPLAEVPGTLQQLAVNDSSIFAIDTTDGSLVEIGVDGSLIGKIMTRDKVSEVVAFGDWVAWVEAEGNGKIIRRRRAGKFESMRPFTPHIAASAEGLFYSDLDLIASWPWDGVPERVATPASGATLIGIDPSYAYTREMDKSLARYMRMTDMKELVIADATGTSLKDGQLAYRGPDGVHLRDLFTGFDRVIGTPPADYTCELLIAGTAVMCGKYRLMNGMTDEILTDPVGGYASRGKDVYWVTTKSGSPPVSQIRLADAEAPLMKSE